MAPKGKHHGKPGEDPFAAQRRMDALLGKGPKEGPKEERRAEIPRPAKITNAEIRQTCARLGLDADFIFSRPQFARADRGKLNAALEMLERQSEGFDERRQPVKKPSQLAELSRMKEWAPPGTVAAKLVEFIEQNLEKR